MPMFHNQHKRKESAFDVALQRWFHVLTGYCCFSIFLGAWSFVSLLLVIGCVWLFTETGGMIFLAAALLFAACSGGLWVSVHGMNRQLQFGHVAYLFKELWKHIRQNFLQGACFGVLLSLVCAVLYLPVVVSQMLGKELPFALVCLILLGTLLLPVWADYTFYQISHWRIRLLDAARNSFFLMLQMGWRSIAVCTIWIAYYILLEVYPHVLVPLSLFCGLMSVLNMTTQALFVPKMDMLMGGNPNAPENASPTDLT